MWATGVKNWATDVKNWATEQGSGPNLRQQVSQIGCSGLHSHKLRIAKSLLRFKSRMVKFETGNRYW